MSDEPIFLDVENVLDIHAQQIDRFGGADGVLDENLLKSAVEMPRSRSFGQYLHADLYEMAAAYLFHLAKNHAFRDGNKRVAAAAAQVFLEYNGLRLTASEPVYGDLVLRVAASYATKADAAAFYRDHTVPA